ncbi:MAG: fibrillarin-like rRNA/tRNA 2'-O-methyltransferase [Halodesulfurarchaeum sp.]
MSLPEGLQRRQFGGETALATRGKPVYGEPTEDGWRRWDPHRSKLGAMLELGLETGLERGAKVLYLGAASGTTVSHVADVTGPTYAVEFAPRPLRDLVSVVETRPNLFPLLADAQRPETYAHVVENELDLLIQDVATTGQARVATQNARFLAADGTMALSLKARSEDVTRAPASVFEDAIDTLQEAYEIRNRASLDPFHADHLAVIATPK